MVRRTISLPEALDALIRASRREGESYSATVARLVEEGSKASDRPTRPAWIGSGESTGDFPWDVEEHLRQIFADPDFRH